MSKFKVGDRVKERGHGIGTIIDIDVYGDIAVRFDEFYEGRHDLDGMCKDGHGWFCYEGFLEHVYIKVKPTRLAKKMYPDAKEEDGYLILEE